LSLWAFLSYVSYIRYPEDPARTPHLTDAAKYPSDTLFMFHDSAAILQKAVPFPLCTRIPYVSDSLKTLGVCSWRNSTGRTFFPVRDEVAYAALYNEHHTAFGLVDTDLLAVTYRASSRDMPVVPSITRWRRLWYPFQGSALRDKRIRIPLLPSRNIKVFCIGFR
jgi:hypothetical protein